MLFLTFHAKIKIRLDIRIEESPYIWDLMNTKAEGTGLTAALCDYGCFYAAQGTCHGGARHKDILFGSTLFPFITIKPTI